MSVVAVKTLFGTSLSTVNRPQTTVVESFITFHLRTAQETVNKDSGRTQTDVNDLFNKVLTQTITNNAQQVFTNTFATETVFSTIQPAETPKPTTPPPAEPTTTTAPKATPTPSPSTSLTPPASTADPIPSPSSSSRAAVIGASASQSSAPTTRRQQATSVASSTITHQSASTSPISASTANPKPSVGSGGTDQTPSINPPSSPAKPPMGWIIAGILLGLILVAAIAIAGWWYIIGRKRRKNGGLRVEEEGKGPRWAVERKFATLGDGGAGEDEEKKAGGGSTEAASGEPVPEPAAGWMQGNGFGRGMTFLKEKLPARKEKKIRLMGSISEPVFVSGPRRHGSVVGLLDQPAASPPLFVPPAPLAPLSPSTPSSMGPPPLTNPFVDSGYLLSDVHPSTTLLAAPLTKKHSLPRKPPPSSYSSSPASTPRRPDSIFSADSRASRGVAVDPYGLRSQYPTSAAQAPPRRQASGASTDAGSEGRLSLFSTARSSLSSGYHGGGSSNYHSRRGSSMDSSPALYKESKDWVRSPVGSPPPMPASASAGSLHAVMNEAIRSPKTKRPPSITLTMATGSMYSSSANTPSTALATGSQLRDPFQSPELPQEAAETDLASSYGSSNLSSVRSSKSLSELPPLFTTAETLDPPMTPGSTFHPSTPVPSLPMRGVEEDEPVSPRTVLPSLAI